MEYSADEARYTADNCEKQIIQTELEDMVGQIKKAASQGLFRVNVNCKYDCNITDIAIINGLIERAQTKTPCRETALYTTKLLEALMWLGKTTQRERDHTRLNAITNGDHPEEVAYLLKKEEARCGSRFLDAACQCPICQPNSPKPAQ